MLADGSNFVLIHGGWAGAWQWEQIVPILEEKGNKVYTPSLTGLGEKADQAAPAVNVSTHISDLVSFIRDHDLRDIVLVGFSYGGMSATVTAWKMQKRIKKLVYLDAFFPLPGQSLFDIFGPKITKNILSISNSFGEGWKVPYFDEDDSRLTDQPLGTTKEAVFYEESLFEEIDPVYIECTEKDDDWSFSDVLKRIAAERREAGWNVIKFPSGHFPMRSKPAELATLLDKIGNTAGRESILQELTE